MVLLPVWVNLWILCLYCASAKLQCSGLKDCNHELDFKL